MNIADLIKRGEMRDNDRDNQLWIVRKISNAYYKILRGIVRIDNFVGCRKRCYQDWKRGYTEDDVLNLNLFILKKIRQPLKDFVKYEAEGGFTLPADFQTDPAAWLETLQKMEYAFDSAYLEEFEPENRLTRNMTPEQKEIHDKKVQEGFELFGKYLVSLWD